MGSALHTSYSFDFVEGTKVAEDTPKKKRFKLRKRKDNPEARMSLGGLCWFSPAVDLPVLGVCGPGTAA